METASHFLEYHSQTVGGNGAQLETDERIFLDRPKGCFQWGFTCNYHTTMTGKGKVIVCHRQEQNPQQGARVEWWSFSFWFHNPLKSHWVASYLQVLLHAGALMLKHGLTRRGVCNPNQATFSSHHLFGAGDHPGAGDCGNLHIFTFGFFCSAPLEKSPWKPCWCKKSQRTKLQAINHRLDA